MPRVVAIHGVDDDGDDLASHSVAGRQFVAVVYSGAQIDYSMSYYCCC